MGSNNFLKRLRSRPATSEARQGRHKKKTETHKKPAAGGQQCLFAENVLCACERRATSSIAAGLWAARERFLVELVTFLTNIDHAEAAWKVRA